MPDTRWNSLTDIAGLRVGHAQDEAALTGCTVILCEAGATGGVDVRGGAPGTRETDALHPLHLVTQVHAIVLAGGSAFGLEAATGVVRYLEQRGIGFDVGVARVPIVPAAILFDLGVGSPAVRPDAAMGYQACLNASDGPVLEGNVGAGIGATVGKARGLPQAMKAGLGACSLAITENLTVAALAVTNAFGDVVDPSTGEILAGARQDQAEAGASPFADTLKVLAGYASKPPLRFGQRENTVLGVVATNARLDKEQVNKVADMAHDGLARAVRPAHTMLDGDTIFALATGEVDADVNIIGAFAAQAFAEAIVRSVESAAPLAGLPSASSLRTDRR